MRTISYQEILQVAFGHDGMPLSRLLVEDQARMRDFINLSLPIAWETENWPDLMRMEERWFRDFFAIGTTYAASSATAAVEVFYPPTAKYYQSLHAANVGNAPAVGSPLAENSAHWAESQTTYSGNDWATGIDYVVGDKIHNTADGRYYQCITAHTSGGSFDATKFGILTPLERSVDFNQTGKTAIAEVVWAGNKNHRIFTSTTEWDYELGDEKVIFRDSVASVWLEYSVRCPLLTGDVFSSTATYAQGQQVYFSSATVKGNFYDCVTATSAGESPQSASAKWAIVELPYIFRTFLAQNAYALWLISDGQHEKAAALKAEAMGALSREANKLWRRQHQVRRTRILTR